MKNKKILKKLFTYPLAYRIEVIWKDLSSGEDVYKVLGGKELCDALWVPLEALRGSDWTVWESYRYMKSVPFDEYVKEYEILLTDMLDTDLEGAIDKDRLAEIRELAAECEKDKKFEYDFLSRSERKLIADAYSGERLAEGGDDSLTDYVSFYTLNTSEDHELRFQVEDNGYEFDIKTPYSERDGGFIDFNDKSLIFEFLN
jgi:hypothetical protein